MSGEHEERKKARISSVIGEAPSEDELRSSSPLPDRRKRSRSTSNSSERAQELLPHTGIRKSSDPRAGSFREKETREKEKDRTLIDIQEEGEEADKSDKKHRRRSVALPKDVKWKHSEDPARRPVIAPCEEWYVEPCAAELEPAALVVYEHHYAREFLGSPHVNLFLTKESLNGDKKETFAKAIVSVLKVPEPRPASQTSAFLNLGATHKALFHLESGYEVQYFHHVRLPPREEDIAEEFQRILNSMKSSEEYGVYAVEQNPAKLAIDIQSFEEKYSKALRSLKIAVLYIKQGQTDMDEIWQNQPEPGSAFFQFLDQIGTRLSSPFCSGERVSMESFTGYRGEVGMVGDDVKLSCYYKKWRHLEIIFHVVPWLNEEQQRRLAGNDVGVLIFYDALGTGKPFVPFEATGMGGVPQVFTVVEQHPSGQPLYRFGFFSRHAVGSYSPACPPANLYLGGEPMVDWLYTKLHNGFMKANSSPPLDRLFTIPRREAIRALGEKYPMESSRDKAKREKAERKLHDAESIADISTLSAADEAQLLAAFAGHRPGSATGASISPLASSEKEKGKKKAAGLAFSGVRKTLYVLMLGASGVGRTSIITRLTDNAFSDTPLSTGSGTEVGYVDIDASVSVQIISPHFTTAHSFDKYVQDAHYPISGVIYVVEAGEQKSQAEIVQWFSNVPEGIPLTIFVSRSDLHSETHVPKIALLRNCKTHFMSAKTGNNVRTAFEAFIAEVVAATEGGKSKKGLLSVLHDGDGKDRKTPRTPRKEEERKEKEKEKDKKKREEKEREKEKDRGWHSDASGDDFFARLEAGYQKKK